MIKNFFGALALLCVGAFGVSAQTIDWQAAIAADPEVRVGKLDNGLTYYIRHNAKPAKQAEFYIYHNVGAIQEDDSQIGLAHFLEHMAFNGTKNLPNKQLINYLETIGVKFGANLNAATGQDMTVYNMSSVPVTREGIIDSALLILHDWSYFLTLDSLEINKERGVIIEELRTGNNADFRINMKTAPTVYNGSKYAQRNVIGNEQALRSFSRKELVDFYHKWYRTEMQTLVVVGDFDVDQMEAKIKQRMSDIPAVADPAPKEKIMIPDNVEPLICIATDPEQTGTMITTYIKRAPLPDELNDKVIARKMDVMFEMIGTMANYRLYELSQQPNAPYVNAGVGQGALTATVDVFMGRVIAREGEAAKAFEAFYVELEKIRRFGFTEQEVERVKADMLRAAQQQYDNRNDKRSKQYIGDYINNFSRNAAMPSEEQAWTLDSALISSTNILEINSVTKSIITPTNQVVLVSSPEKEGLAIPTDADINTIIDKVSASELEAYADNMVKEPLISTNLKGSKVKKSAVDKFGATVWTLANGVKVVIKPTDFKADELFMSANSPVGLSVIATEDYASGHMLNAYLNLTGVGKFSIMDLVKQLAGKAVQVSPAISNYQNGLQGECSPKDIETFLQLVYLYFVEPRFDQNDFNMMVDRYSAALANTDKDPRFIMQDNAMKTLYSDNARRQVTSLETMSKIDLAKMKEIYTKLFGNAADFTFTFVGNIDLELMKPLVEKYLGSLPTSKSKQSWKNDNAPTVKGEVTNRFEVAMQAPKTTVNYVYTGEIPYVLENHLTFDALKQVLTIRCIESIREEKGGTYGVRVSEHQSDAPTPNYNLSLLFDTDPAMADELMEIVEQEIATIANDGPKAEDLSKIKEFMLKQRPDDLKNNEFLLNDIDTWYVNGVDITTDYEKYINELSGDKLKVLAAKILKDGNLVRIVMDPKK